MALVASKEHVADTDKTLKGGDHFTKMQQSSKAPGNSHVLQIQIWHIHCQAQQAPRLIRTRSSQALHPILLRSAIYFRQGAAIHGPECNRKDAQKHKEAEKQKETAASEKETPPHVDLQHAAMRYAAHPLTSYLLVLWLSLHIRSSTAQHGTVSKRVPVTNTHSHKFYVKVSRPFVPRKLPRQSKRCSE